MARLVNPSRKRDQLPKRYARNRNSKSPKPIKVPFSWDSHIVDGERHLWHGAPQKTTWFAENLVKNWLIGLMV